jgi:hypothetical protein
MKSLACLAHLAACAGMTLTASYTWPACDGARDLGKFAGKSITLAQDTLFFRTENLELDIDGSPLAYGTRDQGLEDICNGLAPLLPTYCRGRVQGECYAACRAAFRQWDGSPATLGNSMCSVGLGGGGCSPPEVQIQFAPASDYFVSETSVRSKAPPGVALSQWVRRQGAQLDSAAISYFVVPGRFRALPWDVTPGDVGVVLKQPGGEALPFIVGDTGGALDEGSAKLLAELRGLQQLPRVQKKNAFGIEVNRLRGAMTGDFRVAIFRHSATFESPQHRQRLVIAMSAADLPDSIRKAALARLQALGGSQKVIDCAR